MQALRLFLAVVDGLSRVFGQIFGWLVAAMVVITFANVLLRYVFGLSYVLLYEANLYAFALVMTACAGWALLYDEHVRVDIFYRSAPPRAKAVIDLLGILLFLSPMLWLLWTRGVPYFERSWRLMEGSQTAGGIPGVWLLKGFILVFVATLALQGLAMACRALATLAGHPLPKPEPRD